jgi:hypothetical protein
VRIHYDLPVVMCSSLRRSQHRHDFPKRTATFAN